jgi:hypothetical protein
MISATTQPRSLLLKPGLLTEELTFLPVRAVWGFLLVTIGGAASYGAVLGLWRAPLQAAFAAVKLPLVLIVTSGLTLIFNWMLASLLGLRLPIARVAVLTVAGLAIAAVVLAALAPVAILFTLSAPLPSTEARTAHNVLYLFHTTVIAGAGLAGTHALRSALDRLAGDRALSRRVHAAWVVTFAFVGGEVAWALRPFVGSIYSPVAFLRPDALDGNMYEFIFTDILPHLLSRS